MKFNVKYFIFAFYFTDFEIVVLKGAAEVSGGGGGDNHGHVRKFLSSKFYIFRKGRFRD